MLGVSRWNLLLGVSLSVAAAVGACSSTGSKVASGGNNGTGGSAGAAGSGGGSGDAGILIDSGGGLNGDAAQGFDVQPAALQTITVTLSQTPPTVNYTATLDGKPVNVGWTVDRGALGAMTPGNGSSSVFTPTGTTGGLVNVIAGLNGKTIQRQVFVKIVGKQNGADANAPGESAQLPASVGDLTTGGGVAGVGGEGLGGAADAAAAAALSSPAGNGQTQGLRFLYPYDGTVWPRGLLAPLVMWDWSIADADAIQMKLETTSGSFSWTGTFAAPQILTQTGGKFIRHPIPADVWTMATNTAGGTTTGSKPDQLTLSLTVEKNGQGYGPISQTWSVAQARLAGTVYYNSYGTQLVKNSIEHSKNNGPQFGAAVLAIKSGDTGPSVVAGTPSGLGSGAGCRVCHTVSSDGSTLIAQHGDAYARTSAYDLKNGNAESSLNSYDNLFGWAGLSPDGKLAFTNAADLAASAPASRLYSFPPTSATPLAVQGIPADLKAGTPAFSPDEKHVAFDFLGGTIGSTTGNGKQLVAMDFDKSTLTFSNLRVLATMPANDANKRAGFPSFFPTNDAVAYHYQIKAANHRYNTWHQATAQIWWSDLATGTAASLDALNGLDAGKNSDLPTNAQHPDDTVLNYEPTVNPVASGGYVWVIFTSRRMYGNLATGDPWLSDPRNYDATSYSQITTKKLWVAAIDLNAKAGTDPSHPAFYLPAQELLAGNARGFWVLEPCRANGQSCQSGDQCCNGYCEPGGDGGALVCTDQPPDSKCSAPQEKCTTAADCCDSTNLCINGFCAVQGPA